LALKEGEPQRRKTKRKEKSAAFNIVVVRVNLGWVGAPASVKAANCSRSGKRNTTAFLIWSLSKP
jgi:hypothetical protein